MEDGRESGRGTHAAKVGGVLGIVPAVGLGVLGFGLSEGPETFPQLAGHVASTLVYLAPYALVLIAGQRQTLVFAGDCCCLSGCSPWRPAFLLSRW